MHKVAFVSLTLLATLSATATTLSDNLMAATFGTELIDGSNWVTAGFRTGPSDDVLSSAALLMQQDSPGTLNVGLYSSVVMQPANSLGYEPGVLLGTLTATTLFLSSLGVVTFSGNNLLLSANTTYWLVLSAPTSGTYEWAYEAGSTGSGIGFYSSWGYTSDSGNSWFSDDLQPMQMSITGDPVNTTPEPNTIGIVLLGVAALTCIRKRLFRKFTQVIPKREDDLVSP